VVGEEDEVKIVGEDIKIVDEEDEVQIIGEDIKIVDEEDDVEILEQVMTPPDVLDSYGQERLNAEGLVVTFEQGPSVGGGSEFDHEEVSESLIIRSLTFSLSLSPLVIQLHPSSFKGRWRRWEQSPSS